MFEIKTVHPHRQVRMLYVGLLLTLGGWAASSTFFGLQKKPKEMPLIVIEDSVPRIIAIENDADLRKEKIKFIKRFLSRYYTYDLETFESQVGDATEMMKRDFWLRVKPSVTKVEEKLKAEPYSEKSSIESITEDEQGGFNASLLTVWVDRVKKEKFRTRVHLEIAMKPRTDINPWRFEVTYVNEQIEPL